MAGNGAGDVVWAGNQGNDVFGGNGGTTVTGGADTIYGYSSPTDTQVAAATWIEGGSGVQPHHRRHILRRLPRSAAPVHGHHRRPA